MNILKILSDIIKRSEKPDPGRYLYAAEDGYVFYSPDGYVLYRIPEERFYLDIEKVFKNIAPTQVDRIWRPGDVRPAVRTGDVKIKQVEEKPVTVVKIKNDSAAVWVNEKLLKNFAPDCDFLITNRFSPVYVVENDEPVGLVLPMKMESSDYD